MEVVSLVSQERAQHRTAETIAVVGLAPRERVQQGSAERIEAQERAQQRTVDAPRPQDKNVLPKRLSERISEQGVVIEVPETAGQDQRLQRTVVQYLDVSVEVDRNVFQERISGRMHDKLSREPCSRASSYGGTGWFSAF